MLSEQWAKFNIDMRKKDWLFLMGIVVGAIIFRLIFVANSYVIGFDQVNYLKLAASGKIHGLNHVLHPYWSPFYPLVVALFSYIVTDFELAGRLVNILCASFIIVPVFFFLKNNFNKKIAFGTSLLIGFYSFSAYYAAKAEAEFLYSFAAIIGVILGWAVVESKKIGKAFLAGIFFGLAYLSRPEGVGFLITFWGVIFLIIIFQIFAKRKVRSYIFILLLSGFGFGIVSFPYLLYLRQATGTWTISTKGVINQQGEMYVMKKDQYTENPFHVLSEDNTKLMMDEIYHIGNFVENRQIEGKTVVKISVIDFAKKVTENFYKIITETVTKVFPLPLIILFGLGLFAKPWPRENTYLNLYLLSYIVFFWFIVIPVFHISLRYFAPLIPIALIWIAKGADNLIEWVTVTIKNSIEKWPLSIPVRVVGSILVILLIFFSSILPEFGRRMKKGTDSTIEWGPCIEQKKAGLWLKENGDESPVIMAYNHAVSFYAGNYNIKESVEIPENKVDRLLAYAKYRGVEYLVLNDRYKHHHPLIEHLYEEKDVPVNLEVIYKDREKSGLKTIIYKIVD